MAIPSAVLNRMRSRRKNKRTRRAAGVKPNARIERKYKANLRRITKALRTETELSLVPLLRKLEPQFVLDGVRVDLRANNMIIDAYAGQINGVITGMARQASMLGRLAEGVAQEWAHDIDDAHKRSFYTNIEKAIGIDLKGVVQEAGLTDIIDSKIAENVSLIKSLPDEYYKKISSVVNNLTSTRTPAKSIIKELRAIGISTDKRAKLIARDQTQKLNASITQGRQQSLGIKEYVWQIGGDARVRPTHRKNAGKTFAWNKRPPITGHPGEDIQCRCVAIPVINIEELSKERR